jgi:hypothetical protein
MRPPRVRRFVGSPELDVVRWLAVRAPEASRTNATGAEILRGHKRLESLRLRVVPTGRLWAGALLLARGSFSVAWWSSARW